MARSRKAVAEPELNAFEEVYKVVRRIPRGRVATYGQVAKLLPRKWSPALVGWALHALPSESDVPWFRVLDSKGQLGTRKLPGESVHVQKDRLAEEGIDLDAEGRCDLARHQWKPRVTSAKPQS